MMRRELMRHDRMMRAPGCAVNLWTTGHKRRRPREGLPRSTLGASPLLPATSTTRLGTTPGREPLSTALAPLRLPVFVDPLGIEPRSVKGVTGSSTRVFRDACSRTNQLLTQTAGMRLLSTRDGRLPTATSLAPVVCAGDFEAEATSNPTAHAALGAAKANVLSFAFAFPPNGQGYTVG